MRETFEILAIPVESLKKIVQQPKILAPLATTSIVLFMIMWLNECWQNIAEGIRWYQLLGPLVSAPTLLVAAVWGSTFVLYLFGIVLNDEQTPPHTFKTLLSINAHCAIIFLLGEVVNFLLARTGILGEHLTPLLGRFPVGLDLLLLAAEDPNIYLSIILHSTSVFLIWYLVVLALGIHLATGMSKARAAFVSASLWITIVLLALCAAYAAGGDTTIRIRF
jgi:hypothetical protein